MNKPNLNRRDVNRLALVALGGLVSGAFVGCGPSSTSSSAPAGGDADLLLQDPHICRGINACKNKGKEGTTNDCAGQGHCATVKGHSCDGQNDCKGHGGCGEHPGENSCKGKGACAVPLTTKAPKNTWAKARKHFEEVMAKDGKKFGDAPPES